MCPIPRYLNAKNKVRAIDVIAPCLVFPKRREKVNKIPKKVRAKNPGIAPKEKGSTK